ncbi:transporter [Streptomyces sp. NPDC051742]|uniref:transporter n=1 Tax=unclassified Streptomyces TaxID=2593676 RepID=UPI0034423B78
MWNQGVTRTHWVAAKLGLGAAAAVTAAGVASLAVSRWSSPIDRAVNGGGATDTYFPRLDPVAFAARGVVPMGHAAFAFVLGVALGLVIRRTLPAMATTFALYTAVQIAVPMWIRSQLAAVDRTIVPIEPGGAPISIQDGAKEIVAHLEEVPGAWVTSQQTLDAAGRPAPVPSSFADCLRTESGPPTLRQVEGCVADLGALGYKQQVTYQPAGNFWALQWAETGLYFGLALALTGFCARWIRRRVT